MMNKVVVFNVFINVLMVALYICCFGYQSVERYNRMGICRDMHAKKYWQEYKHTFYCKLKLYINVSLWMKLYNINFAPIIVPLLPSSFALDPASWWRSGVLESSRRSPQSARDLGARRRGADGVAACWLGNNLLFVAEHSSSSHVCCGSRRPGLVWSSWLTQIMTSHSRAGDGPMSPWRRGPWRWTAW